MYLVITDEGIWLESDSCDARMAVVQNPRDGGSGSFFGVLLQHVFALGQEERCMREAGHLKTLQGGG